MPGWTSPRTFLAPAPQHSQGMVRHLEVLGLWPQQTRNSSSRVAEALLGPRHGLGLARCRAQSSTFLGGSWTSHLDPWAWLVEVLPCVLCALLGGGCILWKAWSGE